MVPDPSLPQGSKAPSPLPHSITPIPTQAPVGIDGSLPARGPFLTGIGQTSTVVGEGDKQHPTPSSSKSNPPPLSVVATLDGLVRTGSTCSQNLIGETLKSVPGATLSTLAVEATRTAVGLVRGGTSAGLPSIKQASLMAVWSVNAVAMTVGHLLAFRLGADQGVANMIVMSSILPGIVVDSVAFKDRPSQTKIASSALLLAGCYIALGAPGLATGAAIGGWVAIKAGIACALAINEGVRRKMVVLKEQDPVKHNFSSAQAMVWVGGISLALLTPVAALSGAFNNLAQYSPSFWLGTAGMAAAVVVSTVLSLAVYVGGGSVVARKVVTTATAVVGTIATGALFFSESLTAYKIIGAALVVAATVILALEKKKK